MKYTKMRDCQVRIGIIPFRRIGVVHVIVCVAFIKKGTIILLEGNTKVVIVFKSILLLSLYYQSLLQELISFTLPLYINENRDTYT